MSLRGVTDTIRIEPADILKRKRLLRQDMHFAADPHAIAERFQVLGQTESRRT